MKNHLGNRPRQNTIVLFYYMTADPFSFPKERKTLPLHKIHKPSKPAKCTLAMQVYVLYTCFPFGSKIYNMHTLFFKVLHALCSKKSCHTAKLQSTCHFHAQHTSGPSHMQVPSEHHDHKLDQRVAQTTTHKGPYHLLTCHMTTKKTMLLIGYLKQQHHWTRHNKNFGVEYNTASRPLETIILEHNSIKTKQHPRHKEKHNKVLCQEK